MSLDKNDLINFECVINISLKESAAEAETTTARFEFFETAAEMRKVLENNILGTYP